MQQVEQALALGYSHRLKVLKKEWGLEAREFDRLVEKAKESILAEAQSTSRFRRAAMLRKVQIAVQKAMDEKKYSAVASLVAREEQLSSGLGNAEYCERAAKELGAPPTEPKDALVFARRALLLNLPNILSDSALSTKERTFLLNDTCAKLGMTHDRAEIESLAKRLEEGKTKAQKDKATQPLTPGQWKGRGAKRNDTEKPPPSGGRSRA